MWRAEDLRPGREMDILVLRDYVGLTPILSRRGVVGWKAVEAIYEDDHAVRLQPIEDAVWPVDWIRVSTDPKFQAALRWSPKARGDLALRMSSFDDEFVVGLVPWDSDLNLAIDEIPGAVGIQRGRDEDEAYLLCLCYLDAAGLLAT